MPISETRRAEIAARLEEALLEVNTGQGGPFHWQYSEESDLGTGIKHRIEIGWMTVDSEHSGEQSE